MSEETIAESDAFVADVRDISNLGSGNILSSIGNLLSGESKAAFDAFKLKINASQVLNTQPAYLLAALGEAGGAIGEVLATTLNGARPTSTVAKNGVTVTSSITGSPAQRHIYTVKQDINVCKTGDTDTNACNVNVDLTLQLDFPAGPTGAQSETSLNLTAASGLRVGVTTGVIKNAYLSAQVLPATGSSGHVQFSGLSFRMDSAPRSGWDTTTALSLNFSNMALNLPLTLTQLNATNPVSATVTLKGTGPTITADVTMLGRKSVPNATTTTSRIKADIFALKSLAINATAEIKDSAESLNVKELSLSANGDKVAVDEDPFDDVPAPPAYVVILDTNQTCSASGSCKSETVIDTEGETVAQYLTALIGLDFAATLSGVDPVTIKAAAGRSSDDLISLDSFNLVSEESTVELSADINLEGELVNLDALNKAGLKLQITSNASGARSGTLVTSTGEKVADVTEQDGKIIINYVNGTSVVL